MRLLPFVVISLGLFGCASKDFGEPKEEGDSTRAVKRTFSNGYTDVWNGVLKVLENKNYPIAETRKDKGIVVSDWIRGKSDRLFSGYGDSRIPYTVRSKLTVDVQPTKSGTRVIVINKEQYYTDAVTGGFDFQGSLYQWLDTPSSGAKEDAVLQELSTLMGIKK